MTGSSIPLADTPVRAPEFPVGAECINTECSGRMAVCEEGENENCQLWPFSFLRGIGLTGNPADSHADVSIIPPPV